MSPTGFGAIDTLAIWCVAIAAIAAGCAITWRLLRGSRRIIKRVDDFFTDWIGEEARPGVPGRAGVMERLDAIEHQLKPNSGESLRDAVNRIEDQLTSPTD